MRSIIVAKLESFYLLTLGNGAIAINCVAWWGLKEPIVWFHWKLLTWQGT